MYRKGQFRLWAGIALLLFVALPALMSAYGDFLWFDALGYSPVFLKQILYAVATFTVFGVVAFAVLYGSHRWAVNNIRELEDYTPHRGFFYAILGVAFLFGLGYSDAWQTVLKFVHSVTVGVQEPVFAKDIGFYLFSLPFYELIVTYLLTVVTLGLGYAAVLYGAKFGLETRESEVEMMAETTTVSTTDFDLSGFLSKIDKTATTHLAVYGGVLFLLIGALVFLSRYDLLLQQSGAVFGAGFTDIQVSIPVKWVLTAASVLTGAAIMSRRPGRKAVIGMVAFLVGAAVVGNLVGAAVQGYVVEPDEFNKERQYIENEINLTRQAYALNRIEDEQFNVSPNLTAAELEDNPETVDNIRLWDWRPLLKTYNQIQLLRNYYRFNDVDIDRYTIDNRTTQVMVSPREIDFEALPEESQSWVNQHLVYTHGFGVAMSPVKDVTQEGLPRLLVKDIPPTSTEEELEIEQPRIYYGENTDSYNIVNTGTDELDYPRGGSNVYTTYNGTGGVRMDGLAERLTYASKFSDLPILVSDSITDDSRIQFRRDIEQRVRRVAPFLTLDEDPYMVIADGKLYWVLDAYTTSDSFPYSRPTGLGGDQVNYVRNSVKVVVDAYSGETDFYVADEGPIIESYSRIFPSLFQDMDEMPTSIRDHVRYPQDFFSVQAELYRDYHMKDPRVFYNKEDRWRVPNEVYEGNEIMMEPYYVVMKLPGEEEAEFVQILPFVPRGRENMVGWLASRSDPPNYGDLQSFVFTKQSLIFGPMQVESRIDQDTEISQRITLWSQSGSSVIRGNLLAIPIEDSVLYVEPLYLQSREQGSLPQLKQVIVAQGDSLAMQPTLDQALDALFNRTRTVEPAPVTPPTVPGEEPEQLSRVRELFGEAQQAFRDGDFALFGEKMRELEDALAGE